MKNFSEIELVPHSRAHKPALLERFRSLFYALSPAESSFKDVSYVPDYLASAFVCFFMLIILEAAINLWKRKRTFRLNDGITSVSAGQISNTPKLFTSKSLNLVIYIYVYENWRLLDLPWDSTSTWIIAFIGFDFLYYWFHRAVHEINLFWAFHQTHHSSEDYNLTTALRQSSVQRYCSLFLYVFHALIIPPSVHLVHSQINLLYQFWIHTELVETLGPLEYILNTPSHHRVHHGRNPYCIDKNYAGVLIIWDRLFGTFAAERKDEEIAYGLVHPLNSFNPIYVQFGSLRDLMKRSWKIPGLWNKLSVLLKGPGWSPGEARLGNHDDIPAVETPIRRYDRSIPTWLSIYIFVHYVALVPVYDHMMALRQTIPGHWVIFDMIFVLGSFTSISLLLDERSFAAKVECLRCSLCALLIAYLDIDSVHILSSMFGKALMTVYGISAFLWLAPSSGKFVKMKNQ